MDQLDDLHITYHAYRADRLKAEMFNVWLKSSPSASWADLITALEDMDEDTVASDIAHQQVMYDSVLGAVISVVSTIYRIYSIADDGSLIRHSFTHKLTHSLTRVYSPPHSLIHLITHSCTHHKFFSIKLAIISMPRKQAQL